MRTRHLLTVAGLALAVVLAGVGLVETGCGKKKDHSEGSSSRSKEPATNSDDKDQQAARGKPTQPPDSRNPDDPNAGKTSGKPKEKINEAAESPTGIAECDAYLAAVCKCAQEKKDAVLQKACQQGKATAARSKADALKDPETIPDRRQSCTTAASTIRKAFGCK